MRFNLNDLVEIVDKLGISYQSIELQIDAEDLLCKYSKQNIIQLTEKEEVFSVKTDNVRKVLGGVSLQTLRRGKFPGVTLTERGFCEVNMNSEWVVENNIAKEDFKNATQRFVRTKEAQRILGYKTYGGVIAKIKKNKFKYGSSWLYSIEEVRAAAHARRMQLVPMGVA